MFWKRVEVLATCRRCQQSARASADAQQDLLAIEDWRRGLFLHLGGQAARLAEIKECIRWPIGTRSPPAPQGLSYGEFKEWQREHGWKQPVDLITEQRHEFTFEAIAPDP